MTAVPTDAAVAPAGRWLFAGALALAALAAAPIVAVLASLAAPFGETIRHVARALGPHYATGTAALAAGAGLSAAAIGAAAALIVALCEFPGRKALSFALVLPLAVPSYIAAYAYNDLFAPFGALGGLGVSMRSLPGAAFVLAITLYPYVYLLARASFAARSAGLIEAARTLGASPFRAALTLLLPAARPAIAGGAALVMMETAAEFGVADFYGVPTLSVGIFRTWNSFGDLSAAAQLAAGLFLFSLLLVLLEAATRRGRTAEPPRGGRAFGRLRLGGAAAAGAVILCAAPAAFGFAVPAAVIAAKAAGVHWADATRGLAAALGDSAAIAAAGAALALAAAALLAYAGRAARDPVTAAVIRLATLGYAIPGAVIAIGVIAVAAALRDGLGWTLAGAAALLYAYSVRFLTAAHGAAASGLAAIDDKIDDAARSLGAGPARILALLHLPLMRRSLIAGATIVFVDIVKELPATLILRDFNFETLATRVYRLAGDERLAEAAPNALLLIALSAAPIFVLDVLADRRARAP
jgi:iron(III) transport system permease protein